MNAALPAPKPTGETREERESQGGGGGGSTPSITPDQPRGAATTGRVYQLRRDTRWGGPAAECGAAAPAGGTAPGLSKSHISPQRNPDLCTVELWEGAYLLRLQRPGECASPPPQGERGTVTNFTKRSRHRLMIVVNKVAFGGERRPHFLTCTFPDAVPEPKDIPRIWDNFCRMAEKDVPGLGLLWKKELKTRRSGQICKGKDVPHFRALAWGIPDEIPIRPRRGAWVKVRRTASGWLVEMLHRNESGVPVAVHTLRFPTEFQWPVREWLSATWYEAVGSGDIRHWLAGTNLSEMESMGGVRFYVSKYMAKECDGRSEWAKGRWWGARRKGNIPWGRRVVLEANRRQVNQLLRIARRYVRAVTGRKLRLDNPTVSLFMGDSASWRRLVDWVLLDSA